MSSKQRFFGQKHLVDDRGQRRMARPVGADRKATVMLIKSSLNGQHVQCLGGWVTTAEDHVKFQSCQPRTEKGWTKTGQLKTRTTCPGLASLDFCWGSRWWGQNLATIAWIHGPNLPCVNSPGCWGCNCVGDVFLALNTSQSWFDAKSCLSIVADHVLLFMATIYHLLTAASSKIMIHVTEQSLKLVMNMNNDSASPVSGYGSSRTTFGMW